MRTMADGRRREWVRDESCGSSTVNIEINYSWFCWRERPRTSFQIIVTTTLIMINDNVRRESTTICCFFRCARNAHGINCMPEKPLYDVRAYVNGLGRSGSYIAVDGDYQSFTMRCIIIIRDLNDLEFSVWTLSSIDFSSESHEWYCICGARVPLVCIPTKALCFPCHYLHHRILCQLMCCVAEAENFISRRVIRKSHSITDVRKKCSIHTRWNIAQWSHWTWKIPSSGPTGATSCDRCELQYLGVWNTHAKEPLARSYTGLLVIIEWCYQKQQASRKQLLIRVVISRLLYWNSSMLVWQTSWEA